MDENVRRVFDQVKPSRAQKEAVLNRLLEPERKPMKLKKLTVAAIAAALMLVTCAAAAVTGMDQRLIDFLGWGGQNEELLAPGALTAEVTAEDNGAVLHISQVLMDRYNIMVLADFTAPEGTVLDESEGWWDFSNSFKSAPLELLDQAGEQIDPKKVMFCGIGALNDGAPLDNHLTLLIRMQLQGEGISPDWGVASLFLPAENLRGHDREGEVTVYTGDWSCQIPITWQDMGRSIQISQVSGRTDIPLTQVYLSPMTLQMKLVEHSLPFEDIEHVTLTTKDGRGVSATLDGGWSSMVGQFLVYRLDEITDPAQFRSFTLSIGEEDVEFSLDGPVPAEE